MSNASNTIEITNASSELRSGVIKSIKKKHFAGLPMQNGLETPLGLSLRKNFPIFNQKTLKVPLAFLDSAASTQKPQVVIDEISKFYSEKYSNIHRGAYRLSSDATTAYELARERIARFIGAKDPRSVIFTHGATESINLVSFSIESIFAEGDSIVITQLEHHSNIVPWQQLALRKKLKLFFAPVASDGTLDLVEFRKLIVAHKPKLVSFTALSNSIGSVVPVSEIISIAKECNALTLVDACQSVAHNRIDVSRLDCDFLAFSGHKIYGPTGIGVLYARPELQESIMAVVQTGGGTIAEVSEQGTSFAPIPHRFEAGTPAFVEAVALAAAIEFVCDIGLDRIHKHTSNLSRIALEKIKEIEGIQLYGKAACANADYDSPIFAFNLSAVHPHDLATIADEHGVQIRAGHHCAMPLLRALNIPACARVSFAAYSDEQDIEQLLAALRHAQRLFA